MKAVAGGGDGVTLTVPISNPNLSTSAGSAVKWDTTKAKALFQALKEDNDQRPDWEYPGVITLVHLVVSLGMLVIVPLGLGLVPVTFGATVRRWWPVIAVPGAVSLWLDRGALSITLASIYLAGTLALLGLAAREGLGVVRRGRLRARDVALLTALVTPSIAALSLVAERASYELFGFKLTVLSLTVAHFHFAGFAAALVACLVAGCAPGRAATAAAVSVPLGTGIVLLGFFVGDLVELIGAAVLTAGMWLVGWVLWQHLRQRTADRVTRALLSTSAGRWWPR